MDPKLLNQLIDETRLEDINEKYHPIISMIGIRKFVELGTYAEGDELYFPKPESIVMKARNRRIKREYDGSNAKELARKYGLTIQQIWNILKDAPYPGQITIEEYLSNGKAHPE